MRTTQEIDSLTKKLSEQQLLSFEELKPTTISVSLSGVYVIWDKRDMENALYAGRTKRLSRRLYTNHLMGNKSTARLKKYLVEDSNQTNISTYREAKQYLKDYCVFKFITESDYIERGKIEGLFSFVYNVKYMHEEH